MTPTEAVAQVWRGLRWYLREFTGEANWDRYLAECREHGREPISRRRYERMRADAAERIPINRCC